MGKFFTSKATIKLSKRTFLWSVLLKAWYYFKIRKTFPLIYDYQW
jgi:hypothetical protein